MSIPNQNRSQQPRGLTLNTALQYLEKIENGKIPVNFCEVLDEKLQTFDFRPYGGKDSSSSQKHQTAGIDVGEIIHHALRSDVFALAIKNFDESVPEGFDYEARVYLWITENIVKPGLSPNFIPALMYVQCGNVERTRLIITEAAQNCAYFGVNKPCEVFALHYIPSRTILEQCLLQCVINLHLMYIMGITHGDLHSMNVLVAVLPEPVDLYYNVEGKKIFKIRTKYIVKIFDWDRSYCEALGKNPFIEDMFNYTFLNTNENKPVYDLYTLLCTVFYKPERVAGNEILERLADIYKYDNTALSYKETSKTFIISENEAKNLQKYKPTFTVVPRVEESKMYFEYPYRGSPPTLLVYFLGGAQAREALGVEIVPESVNKAMLALYKDGPVYKVMYYNGFSCRLTTESENLPAPYELLFRENVFEKYVVDSIPENSKYVYNIPNIAKPLYFQLEPNPPYTKGEKIHGLIANGGVNTYNTVDHLMIPQDVNESMPRPVAIRPETVDIEMKSPNKSSDMEIDFSEIIDSNRPGTPFTPKVGNTPYFDPIPPRSGNTPYFDPISPFGAKPPTRPKRKTTQPKTILDM